VDEFKNLVHGRVPVHPLPFEDILKFLKAEKAIFVSASDLPENIELTWLQQKCLRSIVHHYWKRLSNQTDMQTSLKEINPWFLSTAMTKCLERSNEEVDAHDAMLDNEGALPTSITIEGAGIAAVNGIYQPTISFNRKYPRYITRMVSGMGEPQNFCCSWELWALPQRGAFLLTAMITISLVRFPTTVCAHFLERMAGSLMAVTLLRP